MADEENNEDPSEAEGQEEGQEAGGSKGPIKMLASIFILVAMGSVAAVMAIPGKETVMRYSGPYHHSLFEDPFSQNTKDNNQRRYLRTLPHCLYFSYDKEYLDKRATDPLYDPMLRHALGRAISGKLLVEIYEGVAREAFMEELRFLLDPILFPIHIGDTQFPLDINTDSGIRPGLSYARSTFRGKYHDHVLKVDGTAKTLQLNDEPVVTFTGVEEDMEIMTQTGDVFFIDVSQFEPEFQGELQIGVHGHIRQVFATEYIAQ